MKLATWNINSVRLRLPLVLEFLNGHDIDVLCLQETKTEDAHFPSDALAQAGWRHQAYRGEKSYNGVAIISRLPLSDETHLNWAGREDCRHIAATVTADLACIISMFPPAATFPTDRRIRNLATSSISLPR